MTYFYVFTEYKKHPRSSYGQQEKDGDEAEESDRQQEEGVSEELSDDDEQKDRPQTEDKTQQAKVSINFYDSVLAFKDIFTLCHLCFVIMYSCMFECLDIFQHALLQCLYVS